jgi:hypothetical protein
MNAERCIACSTLTDIRPESFSFCSTCAEKFRPYKPMKHLCETTITVPAGSAIGVPWGTGTRRIADDSTLKIYTPMGRPVRITAPQMYTISKADSGVVLWPKEFKHHACVDCTHREV